MRLEKWPIRHVQIIFGFIQCGRAVMVPKWNETKGRWWGCEQKDSGKGRRAAWPGR